MIRGKKGQFLILSVLLLITAMTIIYSMEVTNSYKPTTSERMVEGSIEWEVCRFMEGVNGSVIDYLGENIEEGVEVYCDVNGVNCGMDIINITEVPYEGNWSLHNHTHYEFVLSYESSIVNNERKFVC